MEDTLSDMFCLFYCPWYGYFFPRDDQHLQITIEAYQPSLPRKSEFEYPQYSPSDQHHTGTETLSETTITSQPETSRDFIYPSSSSEREELEIVKGKRVSIAKPAPGSSLVTESKTLSPIGDLHTQDVSFSNCLVKMRDINLLTRNNPKITTSH